MKRSPIRKVGNVGKRRAAGMAKWEREHPCPIVCEWCGQPPDWRGMAVHHIKHRSQGGDESDDNLTWVCSRCHSRSHGIGE